jgi:diguanylate cyclase (GGDEF)-like protein
MQMIRFVQASIRRRLFLGTAVMLLPLLALALGSYYTSRTMVESLEQVVKTEATELVPVTELQKLLLQAAMPPNDYLILGRQIERQQFERCAHDTESAFQRLLSSKAFEEEDERKFLAAAHVEWLEAREMGTAILARSPVANAENGRLMKAFDARISRATDILNRVYELVRRETEEHQARARMVQKHETTFMIVVFLMALAVAVLAGVFLSHSVTRPIRALQDGIVRFSQGDHSFRVVLERKDEFGQLAQTLNTMAERLEFDTLTGIYSRIEFHRRLKREVQRSMRYGRDVSMLMMDLDHFKEVNDTHGHPSGDDALRHVTEVAQKALRATDILARYGGEEFVIILPETSIDDAMQVAERIRASLASEPATTRQGKRVCLTISIGGAVYPGDAPSDDELIAAADKALYGAKTSGRDRVCRFSDLPRASV